MNRKILLFYLTVFFASGLIFANPVPKTIQVGGLNRDYLIYTPQNPSQENPNGIIVCLHGFGRTMQDFFEVYDVSSVADSLNLIMLAPQALEEQNVLVKLLAGTIGYLTNDQISLNSVWGCGLSVRVNPFNINEELNRDVDDVDFINTIIDNVLLEYSMPSENLFVLGTSMGGFMAYQFALTKGEQLSGLISIAGSMGLSIKGMDYSTKVPICDFHSVTDEVVPYSGTMTQALGTVSLSMSKQDVIDYWTDTNLTGTPVIETVDYYPSTNGITAEKITYPDQDNEVIHYKMNGSSHSYFFKKENGDCMDYAEEIMKFINSHSTDDFNIIPNILAQKAFFYPNPVQDNIYFGIMNGNVSIYDIAGREVFSRSFSSGQTDLSSLKSGIYIIKIQSENSVQVNRLIKK